MALTYTPAGELGARCPDFDLPSVDGKRFQLKDFSEANALLVAFICNHCPYVKAIEDRFITLANEWPRKNVRTVAVCSNDPTDYPEDHPNELKKRWSDKKYRFPYLIDEDQAVARAFGAVCTPDFFVYDKDRLLVYRGRLDDSWKNPAQVQRQELKEALQAAGWGKAVNPIQNPAMGCSIKWKNHG